MRHSTRPSSSSFFHSICFCSVRDKVDTRSRALPADAPIDLWYPSSKQKISTRLYCRHALCGWHTPRFFSIVNTYQQPPCFDLAWRNSPCLSSGLGFQYEDILPNFPCLSFFECSHRWRSRFPAHTGWFPSFCEKGLAINPTTIRSHETETFRLTKTRHRFVVCIKIYDRRNGGR